MNAAALIAELGELGNFVAGELVDLGDPPPDTLAHILRALTDLRRELGVIESNVKSALASRMDRDGTKRLVVDGIGEIKLATETKWSEWKHEDLWKVVVARALDERQVDPETGETLEPSWETVARVLQACAYPTWRRTALKAHGIDPTEFAHVEYGAKTVRMP